jgi:hypothetical protein
MLHVVCKQCKAWTVTEDYASPNMALSCSCCTLDHDHAAAANACPGSHPPCTDTACVFHQLEEGHPLLGGVPAGHCWTGFDLAARPEGCTVCRPVSIETMRGSTKITMASGRR